MTPPVIGSLEDTAPRLDVASCGIVLVIPPMRLRPPFSRTAVIALATLLLLVPRDAHAYLDPSAGSVLFQVITAGVLTLGFTLRHWRSRVSEALRRLFRRSRG